MASLGLRGGAGSTRFGTASGNTATHFCQSASFPGKARYMPVQLLSTLSSSQAHFPAHRGIEINSVRIEGFNVSSEQIKD